MFPNIDTPGGDYKLGGTNFQSLTRSTSLCSQIVHVTGMPVPPSILAELELLQVFNYENSTYLHDFTRWSISWYSTVVVAIAVLYDYREYCKYCAWDNLRDPAIQCTYCSHYLSERGV